MRVEEVMTCKVFVCGPETDMQQAARLMWENDCGVLPVVNTRDEVVGLITDRDLCMAAYTRGQSLREMPVRESMSKEVFSCSPSDSLEQAIRVMGDHQVRRLPVVGERGQLLGLLSQNDLLRRIVSLADVRTQANLSRRLLEALASICETRGAELPEAVPGKSAEALAARGI